MKFGKVMSLFFVMLATSMRSSPIWPASQIASTPENRFLYSVRLLAPKGCEVEYMSFAAASFGSWEKRSPQQKGNELSFRFIPPTYREPIQFSVTCRGSPASVFVGSKKFMSMFKDDLNVTAAPQFGANFFLFNRVRGPLSWSDEKFDPMIINKFGEIIWTKENEYPRLSLRKSLAFAVAPDGKILIAGRDHESFLQVFDPFSGVAMEIDFRTAQMPRISHVIHYRHDTNEVYYPSYLCRELARSDEFIPFFTGLKGLWRLWTLPRRSYMGSSLWALSLKTQQVREVWNSFRDFNPARHPSLFTGHQQNLSDRFMDVTSEEQYRLLVEHPRHTATWTEKCHVDWTHLNFVDYRPDRGFLLSLRNLNKIVLLSEEGKLLWSMGEDSTNTYFFPMGEAAFSAQHSARFDGPDRVYLFDNNLPYRGHTALRVLSRISSIGLPSKAGIIRDSRTYPLPWGPSPMRGSVIKMRNGNFFAYAPGNPETPERFVEIVPESGEIKSVLTLQQNSINRGIEALPLDALGDDRFVPLPSDPPAKSIPRKAPHVRPDMRQEIIDTTY